MPLGSDCPAQIPSSENCLLCPQQHAPFSTYAWAGPESLPQEFGIGVEPWSGCLLAPCPAHRPCRHCRVADLVKVSMQGERTADSGRSSAGNKCHSQDSGHISVSLYLGWPEIPLIPSKHPFFPAKAVFKWHSVRATSRDLILIVTRPQTNEYLLFSVCLFYIYAYFNYSEFLCEFSTAISNGESTSTASVFP